MESRQTQKKTIETRFGHQEVVLMAWKVIAINGLD